MRTKLSLLMIVLSLGAALSLTTAAAATAAQRIDLKVLLLGASGSEPSFQAWQAQLRREGVPFTAFVATPGHVPITAATLSQTLANGTQEAKYQAVVVATGGLPVCTETCTSALSTDEWTALQTFEQTFHVRQLTAYAYPGADFGLNPPAQAGAMDGQTATLTTNGRTVFPYLQGSVTFDAGTYGYQSTPTNPATFTTLLSTADGFALVGVFTHADGREEMVQTFDANQYQLQSQLLRHGQLNWATRGTYFGDQRNYLELQVDDLFLPDDTWDATAHVTNYDPAAAIRMTTDDVTRAATWSQANRLRIDMVFNGGGSDAYVADHGSDPLLSAMQAVKSSFGWVNHTYDHPNLDCSVRGFIAHEIEDNITFARAKGLPLLRTELVTGEHSGLANLVPGNPGTIDPPSLETVAPSTTNGTLAAGSYDYAITATSTNGETIASSATVSTTGARSSVRLRWDAICKATSYRIYRRSSPAGAWSLVGTVAQPASAFTISGPVILPFIDRGGVGTPGEPPSSNTAVLSPYGQNPAFIGALTDEGIKNTGGDASKPYPQTPTSTTGELWPAGTSFLDGPARVIPRYPTNVYYNVASQSQLVDEYNHLYLPPWLGGVCVNSATTTCRETPATWTDIVALESQRIFGHMMGNDPRPHYFHQTNLAQSSTADGAVLYPVLDAVMANYSRYFNVGTPVMQSTPTQIADQLARQDAWASASSGSVSGYIEGRRVTIANTGPTAVTLPLTGTEVGTTYGGSHSGWVSTATGTSTRTAATAWPSPPASPPTASLNPVALSPVTTAVRTGPVPALATVQGLLP